MKETDRIANAEAHARRTRRRRRARAAGLAIRGSAAWAAGSASHGDHRLAMAAAIAGNAMPMASRSSRAGRRARFVPGVRRRSQTVTGGSEDAGDRRVVAIDGPGGSGKSTAAAAWPTRSGLPRSTPARCTGRSRSPRWRRALTSPMHAAVARTSPSASRSTLADGSVPSTGRDVSAAIRAPEVTAAVSAVSSHPAVRAVRSLHGSGAWVREHGAAWSKGARHRHGGVPRRSGQGVPDRAGGRAGGASSSRRGGGSNAGGRRQVRASITRRDRVDVSLGRALRAEDAAPDAMVIDTTTTTVGEVVAVIVDRARSADEPQADEPEADEPEAMHERPMHERPMHEREQDGFYRFAVAVVLSVCKVVFRVRVVGRENVRGRRGTSWRLAPFDPRCSVLGVRDERTIRFLGQGRAASPPLRRSLFTAPARCGSSGARPTAGASRRRSRAGTRGTGCGVSGRDTRVGSVARTLFDGVAYLVVKMGVPIVRWEWVAARTSCRRAALPAARGGLRSSSGSRSSRRRS